MIRTYVDNKLISNMRNYLKSRDQLSSEFDYYKSLYNFLIKNKANEVFLAEKNSKIGVNELDSMIKREGTIPFSSLSIEDYVVNKDYDFGEIGKNTVLFFLEFLDEEIKEIEKKYGFFFSNTKVCIKKWKKLTLNNKYAKTLTVSFRSASGQNNNISKILKSYSFVCNSMLLVDRFLRTWSKRNILLNLIPMVEALVSNKGCDEIYFSIICSEKKGESYDLSLKEIYDLVGNELGKTFNLNLSLICISEDKVNHDLRGQVKNIVHDRHLFTNYFHFASPHSFDLIGNQGIKRDTEIIVKSLVESSHFRNSYKKRGSYKELLTKILPDSEFCKILGDFDLNPIFKELS